MENNNITVTDARFNQGYDGDYTFEVEIDSQGVSYMLKGKADCNDKKTLESYARWNKVFRSWDAQSMDQAPSDWADIVYEEAVYQAEEANERAIEDFHGGSGPVTQDEQHRASHAQKENL